MISDKAIEANIYLYLLLKMVATQAIAIAKWPQTEPISMSFDTPVIIAPNAITANSIFSMILKMPLITLFIFS